MRLTVPRLACLCLLLMGVLASSATAEISPQKSWYVLRTPNFHVTGDAGQRELAQVATLLEQFRETIGVLFPKVVVNNAMPTTVLVFRSQRSFAPFKPLYSGKAQEHVGGYFIPGEAGSYIALTTEHGIDLGIIYHEYVHELVDRNVGSVPAWFSEGLAEYYRTFKTTDGGRQAHLGNHIDEHVLLLREKFIPLASLVTVDHRSPLYNERDRASIFYAESWALVHYFILGKDNHAPKLVALLNALLVGQTFDRACNDVLGISAEMLEKELRQYVRQASFKFQRIRLTARVDTDTLGRQKPSPLSPVEAHAILGDLLLRMGRRAEAEEHLAYALSLDPASSRAHASLGTMHLRADDPAKARHHLHRATGTPEASFMTYYFYAMALSQSLGVSGTDGSDADVQAIEAALSRTIEMNPTFADAYARLSWLRSRTPDGMQEATRLIRKAIDLRPGRENYVLEYARLLASQQEFVSARSIAAHLVGRAKDESVRTSARQLLNEIKAHEQRTAEWRATGAGRDDAVERPGTAAGRGSFRPAFRPLAAGETRLFGRLAAIDCTRSGLVVSFESASAIVKATAPGFESVDFVSFRPDLHGEIKCGPRQEKDPAMLVYRPAQAGESAGTLVAIEFVALDFVPE